MTLFLHSRDFNCHFRTSLSAFFPSLLHLTIPPTCCLPIHLLLYTTAYSSPTLWPHVSPLDWLSHLWVDLSLRRSLRAQLPHHRQQKQSEERSELRCHRLTLPKNKNSQMSLTGLPKTLRVNSAVVCQNIIRGIISHPAHWFPCARQKSFQKICNDASL